MERVVEGRGTKNDRGRTVYLDAELQTMFKELWEKRKAHKKILPHVFLNKEGAGPNLDIRRAWNRACRKLGLGFGYRLDPGYTHRWETKLPPGPILHDFRRTAVRNMVMSGIPERVAMMISGHRTRSVFDRYNIVSDADLRQAAILQKAYLEKQSGLGTVHDLEAKRVNRDVG